MNLAHHHFYWILLAAALTYSLRIIPLLVFRIPGIKISTRIDRFLSSAAYAVIGGMMSESLSRSQNVMSVDNVIKLIGNLGIMALAFYTMAKFKRPILSLLGSFTAAIVLQLWFTT